MSSRGLILIGLALLVPSSLGNGLSLMQQPRLRGAKALVQQRMIEEKEDEDEQDREEREDEEEGDRDEGEEDEEEREEREAKEDEAEDEEEEKQESWARLRSKGMRKQRMMLKKEKEDFKKEKEAFNEEKKKKEDAVEQEVKQNDKTILPVKKQYNYQKPEDVAPQQAGLTLIQKPKLRQAKALAQDEREEDEAEDEEEADEI